MPTHLIASLSPRMLPVASLFATNVTPGKDLFTQRADPEYINMMGLQKDYSGMKT